MFDPNSQPTAGSVLAGQQQQPQDPQQVGNTPLADRLNDPSLMQQQQPAPQPTPQQAAEVARHHALGKVTSFLFGAERDPNTGEPVKQQPGAIFRSLLAGALLGGAVGSEGKATGGSAGGFLTGLARGGNAVQQQTFQRQQIAQENARKQQAANLEQDKFSEERQQHILAAEHWNLSQMASIRDQDFRDREQLSRENELDENVQKWAVENGAYIAPTIPHNGEPGNGQELFDLMKRNPAAFNPPTGMGRLFIKRYDFDGLDHSAKDGWTEDGKPVDWSKHKTWTVLYAPSNPTSSQPISMSAAEWTKLYGVKFPAGTDPAAMYNVKGVAPLITVATQGRREGREEENQKFKEKNDALRATLTDSKARITTLEREQSGLIKEGFDANNKITDGPGKRSSGDDRLAEIAKQLAAEKKVQEAALNEMDPIIRKRVLAAAAQDQTTPVTQTPPGKPTAQATPPPQFSVSAWKKANPNGDADAATAEAKRQGFKVID